MPIFTRSTNRLVRYEAHQLKPPLRAFQRWKSWAQARAPECSLVQPDPVTLFTFLEYVAEGGPTAARSLWNQLMFLKTKVGLNFPLEDMKEFVTGTAQKRDTASHCPRTRGHHRPPFVTSQGRGSRPRRGPDGVATAACLPQVEAFAAQFLHPQGPGSVVWHLSAGQAAGSEYLPSL